MVQRRPHFNHHRDDPNNRLGRYLTYIRVRDGLTQKQIARKMRRSRSYVCRIETGDRPRRGLRGSILVTVARAYGVRIEDVLEMAAWPQLLLDDLDHAARQALTRLIRRSI